MTGADMLCEGVAQIREDMVRKAVEVSGLSFATAGVTVEHLGDDMRIRVFDKTTFLVVVTTLRDDPAMTRLRGFFVGLLDVMIALPEHLHILAWDVGGRFIHETIQPSKVWDRRVWGTASNAEKRPS